MKQIRLEINQFYFFVKKTLKIFEKPMEYRNIVKKKIKIKKS